MTSELSTSAVRHHVSGSIGFLTIGQPGGLSTEDDTFGSRLSAAAGVLAADPKVRAVVLRSAGTVFNAGLDLDVVPRLRDLTFARRLLRDLNQGIADLAELPKPVIAEVGGAAFGGGANLARACDFIVASSTATFCEAFVRIGLASDIGSLFLLTRRVGYQRARKLLMTGHIIDAAEALSIGAVDEVVPAARLAARVEEFAGELAAGPPLALAAIKEGLARSNGMSLRDSLALEADLQSVQFASDDFHNAVAAFKGKTAPQFAGR